MDSIDICRFIAEPTVGCVIDTTRQRIISLTDSFVKRTKQETIEKINRVLNKCEMDFYGEAERASGNTIFIPDAIRLSPKDLLLCSCCKTYTARGKTSFSEHKAKSCPEAVGIECTGYPFKLMKRNMFAVLKDGKLFESEPDHDVGDDVESDDELPDPGMNQISSNGLTDAEKVADLAVRSTGVEHLVSELNKLGIANPLLRYKDTLEMSQKLVKFFTDVYRCLKQKHHRNGHSLSRDVIAQMHSSRNVLIVNEIGASQGTYIKTFTSYVAILTLIRSAISSKLNESTSDLFERLEDGLGAVLSEDDYQDESVLMVSDLVGKLMTNLVSLTSKSDILSPVLGLLWTDITPVSEGNAIEILKYKPCSTKARIADAIIHFIKVSISSEYSDSTPFEAYYMKTENVFRLKALMHSRDLSKEQERLKMTGKNPITLIGDLEDIGSTILCGSEMFKSSYFQDFMIKGVELFHSMIRDFEYKYQVQLPSFDDVTSYLNLYLRDDDDTEEVGYNAFKSIDCKRFRLRKLTQRMKQHDAISLVKQLQNIGLKAVFPLMLISMMGPVRSSELALVRYTNTSYSHKQINLCTGSVWLSITKNTVSKWKLNSIMRCVSKKVLVLLRYYLMVIRPLEKQILLYGSYDLERNHLVEYTDVFEDEVDVDDEDGGAHDILLPDNDSSETVGDRFNSLVFIDGDKPLNPSKRSRIMANFLKHCLPTASRITPRSFRHIQIFYTRLVVNSDKTALGLIQLAQPIEEAANHSSATGMSIYAKSTHMPVVDLALNSIWIKFLEGKADSEVSETTLTVKKADMTGLSQFKGAGDISNIARSMFGSGFHFRENQSDICKTIYAFDNQPILLNYQTGYGKTISVLLPVAAESALYQSKKTDEGIIKPFSILLVPFVALMHQYEEVLKSPTWSNVIKTYFYSELQDEMSLLQHDLIVTSLEGFSSNVQINALISKYGKGKPRIAADGKAYIFQRLIIDEAHILIYQTFRYQSTITALKKMNGIQNVSKIFMTGSIYPFDRKKLLQSNDFDIKQPMIYTQERYVRETLSFEMILVDKVVDATVAKIEHTDSGKQIVFCYSKVILTTIVEKLKENSQNIFAIHSDIENKEREHILDAFKAAPADAVLIATTAANSGLDIPDMNSVIMVGFFSLIDIVQSVGRVARKPGSMGNVTFVLNKVHCLQLVPFNPNNEVISSFFDGDQYKRINRLFYQQVLVSPSDETIGAIIERFISKYESADILFKNESLKDGQSIRVATAQATIRYEQRVSKATRVIAKPAKPAEPAEPAQGLLSTPTGIEKRSLLQINDIASYKRHEESRELIGLNLCKTFQNRKSVMVLQKKFRLLQFFSSGKDYKHLRTGAADANSICGNCHAYIPATVLGGHKEQPNGDIRCEYYSLWCVAIEMIIAINHDTDFIESLLRNGHSEKVFHHVASLNPDAKEQELEQWSQTILSFDDKEKTFGNMVRLFQHNIATKKKFENMSIDDISEDLDPLTLSACGVMQEVHRGFQPDHYKNSKGYIRYVCHLCGMFNHFACDCQRKEGFGFFRILFKVFMNYGNRATYRTIGGGKEIEDHIKRLNECKDWIEFCRMVSCRVEGSGNDCECVPFYTLLLASEESKFE